MAKKVTEKQATKNIKVSVGIDVSVEQLDIAVLNETGKFEICRFPNSSEAFSEAVAFIKQHQADIVVLEATGGHEKGIAYALIGADVQVLRANPRRVRSFANAGGYLAKTDIIDATVLARFGKQMFLAPRALKGLDLERFSELVARRNQLVKLSSTEKNRLRYQKDAFVIESLKQTISFLGVQIKEVEIAIASIVDESPSLRSQRELLMSCKGIGNVTAVCFLAQLPELGRLNSKEIASLVGIAPFNNDSGKFCGHRKIAGGRRSVRDNLFIASFSAIRYNPGIRSFYERLISVGKKKKVAIVACMRKLLVILNAMVRSNTAWNPNYAK